MTSLSFAVAAAGLALGIQYDHNKIQEYRAVKTYQAANATTADQAGKVSPANQGYVRKVIHNAASRGGCLRGGNCREIHAEFQPGDDDLSPKVPNGKAAYTFNIHIEGPQNVSVKVFDHKDKLAGAAPSLPADISVFIPRGKKRIDFYIEVYDHQENSRGRFQLPFFDGITNKEFL